MASPARGLPYGLGRCHAKKGATFVRDRPKIAEQFGKNACVFEISVKSNLLILLYEPGSDQGIGGVIQSRCNEIGLPNNLWLDVVNAVRQSLQGRGGRTPCSKCTTTSRPISISRSSDVGLPLGQPTPTNLAHIDIGRRWRHNSEKKALTDDDDPASP